MPKSQSLAFPRYHKKGGMKNNKNNTNSTHETTDAQTKKGCNRETDRTVSTLKGR